jgi:hypothetical protein
LREAAGLWEELGDRAGLAATLHNMGFVMMAKGEFARRWNVSPSV